MQRGSTVVALLLAAVAALLLRQALLLPVGWTEAGPGPGFFPFGLALGVLAAAAAIFLQSVRAERAGGGGDEPFIARRAWRPLLIVFAPMVAIIALMNTLGIYLGSALYLAGYTWYVGRSRPITVVLISVLIPLTLFFIFERWFLMPLPKGTILEFLLYGR